MLCNLKNNNRPDKALQHSLIKLSIAMVTLSLCILGIFLLSEYLSYDHSFIDYLLYDLALIIVMIVWSFILTIKTLQSGEAAISYGGFANEIIKHSSFAERIENPDGECIIQNDAARKLINDSDVLSFIKKYLSESPSNKSAVYRLDKEVANISQEKIIVSLLFNFQITRIFVELKYF